MLAKKQRFSPRKINGFFSFARRKRYQGLMVLEQPVTACSGPRFAIQVLIANSRAVERHRIKRLVVGVIADYLRKSTELPNKLVFIQIFNEVAVLQTLSVSPGLANILDTIDRR